MNKMFDYEVHYITNVPHLGETGETAFQLANELKSIVESFDKQGLVPVLSASDHRGDVYGVFMKLRKEDEDEL